MMALLLRVMSLMVVGCVVVVLLALGLGHLLPQDEVIYSASFTYDGSDMRMYRMDIRSRLVYPFSKGYEETGALDLNPVWSPDGSQIAFIAKISNETHIYTMDALGGHRQRISNLAQYNFGPKWSPDGRWLAYISTNDYLNFHLMLTDLQTTTTTRLVNRGITSFSPSWSPDSQRIAFMGIQARADIYVVDIVTGEITLQSPITTSSDTPAWSPNGEQIAFVGYNNNDGRSLEQTDLYRLNLRDGTVSIVANSQDNEQYPAWSPDGRYLLYVTDDNFSFALYDTLNATTTRLPIGSLNILGRGNWSSDGRYILYTAFAYNFGASSMYRLNAALCIRQPSWCIPERLTGMLGDYSLPDWRPIPP